MKVCIIGYGIAGLYSAYLLQKKGIDFTIYEKNKVIGGRIKNIRYDNVTVVAGAGVGRKSDVLLSKLCSQIKARTFPFQAKSSYTSNIRMDFTVLQMMNELKKIPLNANERSNLTFRQFGMKYLGVDNYKKLVLYTGETDYENQDVIDVLYDYGWDKSFSSGFDAFSIDWNNFLEIFYKLFDKNIVLDTKIEKIKKSNNKFIINKKIYDKVIIATTIDGITDLLNNITDTEIYDDVCCQPFVRLYVKLDSPLNMNGYSSVITYAPFQKVIEMNKDKSFYMISYSDNEASAYWKKLKSDELKDVIEKEIYKHFKQKKKVIKKPKLIYWKCGTHYFKPLKTMYKTRNDFLKQAQNPTKNIYVVGEAFSRNQGWCEGALQSVQKIIKQVYTDKSIKKSK